ncbi:hypothetical protein [Haliovirga abyssi]|uniref:Uracil-DNA glycosylase n=1 Tax=Haliovirga abyssi TaxID=2996794 RepID=A0AAU9DQK2_9FUSO|nr:hypothetical protein [Haliovirga abyssi]BDU50758.1 hypothetical protein HLVA_13270 [Haliovirga abyssi]
MRCKWYFVCPMKFAYEEGRIERKWIDRYCLSESNWKNCVRYQMEEIGKYHSDEMLPDGNYIEG